jgi:ribosome-associated heat shock protein Hsp15
MRIDKYLWCVRLFKTRALATEQVRGERVIMDDHPVKASREVKPGNSIVLKRHGYEEHFEVLAIPKARLGAKLVPDYLNVLTPQSELDKKEFLAMAKNMSRERGTGRPTKKDRRDLDEFGVAD